MANIREPPPLILWQGGAFGGRQDGTIPQHFREGPQLAVFQIIPDIGNIVLPTVKQASSSEFAGRFGQWSFTAQSAPVQVTNQKTGVELGYFVSASEFEAYLEVREPLPQARIVWEMPDELAAEPDKPIVLRRPELDSLMQE